MVLRGSGSRTVPLYLAFSFLQDLALVYPVYMILFQERGVDFLRLSWLLAIWGVPVLLMEVPSGVLADLWSRKWTLVIGMVLKGAGFLVWLVRPDFTGFALGFVLWGVQEGMCTGVGEALLYDALAEDGREERFVQFAGGSAFLQRAAVLLSVLVGGVVYTVSVPLVLGVSAVAMVAAAGCVALIREPERRAAGSMAGGPKQQVVRQAVGMALRVPFFLPLVVLGSLAVVVYGVLDEYDFLLAREYGVPVALVGLWGGLRFLMEGLGALAADRVGAKLGLGAPGRLAVWLGGAGILLVVAMVTGSVYALPLYFLFFFMMSMGEVLFHGWVQHRIESDGRATVSSLVSLVYEALGLGLILFAGPVSQRHGLPAVFIAGGVVATVAAAVLGGWYLLERAIHQRRR